MRAEQHWHRWSGDRSIDLFADPHSRREFPRDAGRQTRRNRNRASNFSPLLAHLRFQKKIRRVLLPSADDLMFFTALFFGQIEPDEEDFIRNG